MFSKISQLGKTFTDEINRINDEVNTLPSNEQKQIADPATARKILTTKTPEISEIDKPEDLAKEDEIEKVELEEETTADVAEKPLEEARQSTVEKGTEPSTNGSGHTEPVSVETTVPDAQLSNQDNAAVEFIPGTQISLASLPVEVRSRLNKFSKYEKKYPQLYDAYKLEKRKTSLINAFENMLKEQTPCSSIGELDGVRDYLKSLESKSKLLNSELTKVTKEKQSSEDQVELLSKKVKDLQKALTSRNNEQMEEINRLKDDNLRLKGENLKQSDISAKYEKLLKEKELLKSQVKELQASSSESAVNNEGIEQLKNEISALTEELNTVKNENEELLHILESEKNDQSSKFELLSSEKNDLVSRLDILTSEKAHLSSKYESIEAQLKDTQQMLVAQKEGFETKSEDLTSKVKELETLLASSKKLNDSFKEKLNSLSTAPKDKKASAPANQGKSAKSKKNKKQNGSKITNTETSPQNSKITETLDPESSELSSTIKPLTEVELIELKHKAESLEKQLNDQIEKSSTLAKDVSSKNTEIEELKDMLRDVGDSLVESQKLNKNTKEVEKELQETKADLDSKLNELEILRLQNANALTDYEQTKSSLSKKMDMYIDQIKGLEESIEAKDSELLSTNQTKSKLEAEIKNIQSLLSKQDSEKERLTAEIKQLTDENQRLKSEIENLKEKASDATNSKGEIQYLKAQLSRKENMLMEADNKIKFLQEEKNKINDEMIELKVQNKELISRSDSFEAIKISLTKSNEKLKSDSNEYVLKINKISLENTKLLKQLEELTDKYNSVKHIKSTSNDQVESFKKRVDELNMRNKEFENRIDMLEEELTQSRNMLQERTREMSTMRNLLMDNEEAQNSNKKDMKLKYDRLVEEKENSDNEHLLIIKNKQREIDELKRKLDDLTVKLEALESSNLELNKHLKSVTTIPNSQSSTASIAESSNDPRGNSNHELDQYNSKMIDSLRDSLTKTEARLREIESINAKLRLANQDSSDKLIRLNKKYKVVLQQYKRRMFENSAPPSRNNSFVGDLNVNSETINEIDDDHKEDNAAKDENENEDVKEKSIYIKNVLLGYLEHKEQRQMLLPVIKMLLYMSEDDANKMNNLLV